MVDADMDPEIERAVEAFNDHDADRLMDEMAEGATFTDPLEDNITGAGLHEYTAEIFEGFPDVRLEVDRVITGENGVTAIEGTYVGTHEGPLEGIPPTGNSVVVPTVTVIDVSADGITSWRDYWDQQTFSEQLGLTFPDIVPLAPKIAAAKVREFV
jgi:steroid delta-isomerase-like uncharacterized protein